MAESYVGELITETARLTLGVPVNPHMFRTAAATISAIRCSLSPPAGLILCCLRCSSPA